jgi:hypothetical protein
MSTITFKEIAEIHHDALPVQRKVLEELFPKVFHDWRTITTLDDALRYHGLTESEVEVKVNNAPDGYQERLQTTIYLDLICDAIRGNDAPIDYSNSDQKKWCPWFQYGAAAGGFGFQRTNYHYAFTRTRVGARRSFLSEEKARFFGETFIDLINKELIA